jgi:GT2 family glycosyltransferase
VARVTVIVVNWNGGEFVIRCLRALEQQTCADFRAVVVDNASSDGSAERIEREFPGVKLLRAGGNLGFAAGNNLGFRHAEGSEWVALLNPDAFVEPDWLEKLVAAAEAHPDCASIGSRLLRADDPRTLDGTGDVYHVSGVHWREGFGRPLEAWALAAKEIFSPCAASALYRLCAIRSVGGFDEDYFCYSEDVDLGFRLRLAGYRSWYAPDSVAHHVGSATTGKTSDFTIYHGCRNTVWTYVKNMPGLLFWLLLPAHLAVVVMLFAKLAWRGQGTVAYRAFRDAAIGLGGALRKRRAIQSTRRAGLWELWCVLNKALPGFRR